MQLSDVVNGYIFTPIFSSSQYIFQETPVVSGTGGYILMESGERILTEGGDGILQE